MNSSDANSHTPLRYTHRSPVVNFLKKEGRTLLSRTSNSQTTNLISHGSQSRKFKETNSFHVFPVVKTPPTKLFSKITNPFESALADRLHLPLIGSPTLFQRPPTPQLSSTQFAWTIDDVSSLQPAHVEPHETQFHDSPDPDYEAKAQSAISSYFKDQQIVPSPVDCPLRSQRIVLSQITGNTPISKPGRRIRDNIAQTVLSLPPKLPHDLEKALAPYFVYNENQQTNCVPINDSTEFSKNDFYHDARDASLRRKLFDHHSVACVEYENENTFAETDSCVLNVSSPPPKSPEVVNSPMKCERPLNNLKRDSSDKSSFGSLSPIMQSSSPINLKRKSRVNIHRNFRSNKSSCSEFSDLYHKHRCPTEIIDSPYCKKTTMSSTTPERSLTGQSSPYGLSTGELSIDSTFNVKIKGLHVDTTKRLKPSFDVNWYEDETQDADEEDLQLSQLSSISNASSESETPRSKRRSASRKNLSQSFTFQCSSQNNKYPDIVYAKEQQENLNLKKGEVNSKSPNKKDCSPKKSEHSIFCRTDSGFNEMTTSSTQWDIKFEKLAQTNFLEVSNDDADISMLRCSTPSKH